MAKIDESKIQVYVICEGVAYTVSEAPAWLNQDNWLCDWIFVGACTPEDAVKIAAIVDSSVSGRVYGKTLNIRDTYKQKILDEEAMSPLQIFESIPAPNSNAMVYRQGWINP